MQISMKTVYDQLIARRSLRGPMKISTGKRRRTTVGTVSKPRKASIPLWYQTFIDGAHFCFFFGKLPGEFD
jgi:hypothetical protein